MNVTGTYWLQVNIGLANGLCRQAKAIKWAKCDPVLCCQIASPGPNELIDDDSDGWLNRELNSIFCQLMCLCSIASFLFMFAIVQLHFGKAIYLMPAPTGSLLFVLLASTFGVSACGCTFPLLLSNGSWGAARRRPDIGIVWDPALCMVLWRIDKLTWRKQSRRQTSLCPGCEWLAVVVLWFHWNVFISSSSFQKKQHR